MSKEVQIVSANQVVNFEKPNLECEGNVLSIEQGEGRNVYRVWFPLGEAAPVVVASQGAVEFISQGSEFRTTYPQFAAETQLPDNTLISYSIEEGGETLYYGVREESVESSYADYTYYGSTPDDAPPVFLMAYAIYEHEGTTWPCLAIAFSQATASDAACSDLLSIEGAEGPSAYRIWHPLGSVAPTIKVSYGGVQFVRSGTDSKTTYDTFSGEEELPEDGTILIYEAITVGSTTLYYGVQEVVKEYAYVEYSYFGAISENDPPAFMIAYGVYESPEGGGPCPAFVNTQVRMGDNLCSEALSIESGTGDNVYRVWFPLGGEEPLVIASRGTVTRIGPVGSEVKTSYPQFSNQPELPPDTVISYAKTSDDGSVTSYYGVQRLDVESAYIEYSFAGATDPNQDPAFLLAFGIYEDPDSGEPCIGFTTSQAADDSRSECDDSLSIERGPDPDTYDVVSSICTAPSVRASYGTLAYRGFRTEIRERYDTFSGVEEPEGEVLVSFTANGLLYGVAKITETVNINTYHYAGAISGIGEPAYMIAYCIADTGRLNDDGTPEQCVALTSTEVGMQSDLLCEGGLTISTGENPNEVVVYADENISTPPVVAVVRGSLTLLRVGNLETKQDFQVFQNEESLPSTGQILLWRQIQERYYGVVLQDIRERAYTYRYTPPAADLQYLCLDADDPNYDKAPEPPYMIAWAVYQPTEASAEPCVAFSSSRVSYDCSRSQISCEDSLRLSISAGERANTAIVSYTYRGRNVQPKVIAVGGSVSRIPSEGQEIIESVEQFSGEIELPADTVAHFKVGQLYYGWRETTEEVETATYRVSKANVGSIAEDVLLYAYMVDGPCIATASTSIPVTMEDSEREALYPKAELDCWVELEHKDSELLYVSYASKYGRKPTMGGVGCSLVYRGKDVSSVEHIVEFEGEEKVPDNAIFSVARPNFDRYSSSNVIHRELYYGFYKKETESIRHIYEIEPDDILGREVMYAYAYFADSKDCNGYDQIEIPPPYEEPQYEEFEAYRVVSRVIATEEGVFRCPGPDYQDIINSIFDEEGADLYQISEIVHEQGFISQVWNRRWARPEIHHHEDHPWLPLLVGHPALGIKAQLRDDYIVWNKVDRVASANADVVPGGRPIAVVYDNLSSIGEIPVGVKRRWPDVRLLNPNQFPVPE